MSSKVVISENPSKHKSQLIKAFQSIDLKDFSKQPDGVWGSKAIIKSGNVTIDSSELDLEFVIPFDDNLESNEGEILVYNLSNNTKKELKADAKISIKAGYGNDTGVLFDGYITKCYTNREGADRVTVIKVIDDIGEKKSINKTYSGKPKSETILKELVNETGLPIGKFTTARNHTYDKDVTVDEQLETAIEKYSEVCGVSTFTSKGKIYTCKLSQVDNGIGFNVNEDTGMIGSPSPFEEKTKAEDYEDTISGYDIEMLLQHRMAVGARINLKSEQYNGTYYVKSGEHRFNESECVTKIRVVS